MEGKWISILEYASFKKKSISTVRRSIKAKRVKFKEENGKYFIWCKNFLDNSEINSERQELEIKFENERLKKELRNLREELEELRMLVGLYESEKKSIKNSLKMELPELPRDI